MSKDHEINFSKFFLIEFCNGICEIAQSRFSDEDYNAIEVLISNLKTEEEFEEGMELLAREHSTSELSIFLFDIMDRIMDYPPTLVYDSIPEMAEDFVNTLEIMLEEEETIETIKRINLKISQKTKAESEKEPEELEKEPVLESVAEDDVNYADILEKEFFNDWDETSALQETEKTDQEASKEPEGVAEGSLETFEEKPIPETGIATAEYINYEDFLKKEFYENLNKRLTAELNEEDADKLITFTDILLLQPASDDLGSAPECLQNLKSTLLNTFHDDKSAADHRKKLNDMLPQVVENLVQLEKEFSGIIVESINENKIIVPEKEAVSSTVDEEEKQPTSIDDLLSAYFQSEIDEYLDTLGTGFENLKNDPESLALLEFLENKFHSFKEVSMIHGYDIIESLCSRMIQILSDARLNKYIFTPHFYDISDELLAQFRQSEKFRGKTTTSEEGLSVDAIINRLEESIDKESEFEPVKSKTEQIQEESEKLISDKEISSEDTHSILLIFKDLVNDIHPHLEKELLASQNPKSAKTLFEKILHAADIMNIKSIKDFCVQYANRLDVLDSLQDDQFNTAAEYLSSVLGEVASNISEDFNQNDWEKQLSEFDAILKPFYTIKDSSRLLSALIELEQENVDGFKEKLQKIVNEQNEEEKNFQLKHFQRLHKNLQLLAQPGLLKFAKYFSKLFEEKAIFNYSKEILEEIAHSYHLYIKRIQESGEFANTNEIVDVLDDVIREYSESEAIEKTSKDEEPVEEETEDLDQIFKDESQNYLTKITDALTLLEDDSSNREMFDEVEKNIHSLKSSARLMGFDDIANMSGKIEHIAEKFHTSEKAIEADELKSLKNAISGLKYFIEGENVVLNDFDAELEKIEENLKSLPAEEVKPEIEKETKPEVDEKPLFASEDDEDMLEIFKEESAAFIKIIENTVKTLEEGRENAEDIHQFEYASHSLKSAAKMLGFREIGQIADALEKIAESLGNNEIIHDKEIHDLLVNSIDTIKSLSEGKRQSSSDITDLLNRMELQRIAERQKKSVDTTEVKPEKTDRIELDPMVDLFLKEAWELLEKINHDLVSLEKKHDNELLVNLNRNVHTLKGSAQMMQFEKISQLAHTIEDYFEKQINVKEALPEEDLSLIFRAVDEIQEMMSSIKNGLGEVSKHYQEILTKLGVEVPTDIASVEEKSDKIKTDNKSDMIESEEKTSLAAENKQLIKISTDRLDSLINMAAELVINKTQLINYIEGLKKLGIDLDKDRQLLKGADYSLDEIILKRKEFDGKAEDAQDLIKYSDEQFGNLSLISKDFKQTLDTIDFVSSQFNTLTQNFEHNISRISHLIKMLHDDILQVRMLPVENLFNRFPRVVRDLAHQQKKKIDLVIKGEKTEMDRAMIESLTDPIMHLVRNAIDHGIETPKDRKRDGKSENGTILLKAHQDKNQIIIEVQDDGKGIDIEAVKKKIIEKNLIEKDKLSDLSPVEILDFIFSPGFSTKDEASTVSGRGIGLDVVADQVRRLKGDIRVNSTPGKGTVFSIRVPLTLIISQAMLFKLADQVMAVPLISVEKSIQFDLKSITVKDDEKYIVIRDESIPVFDLNELLKFAEPKKLGEVQAIIIQETGVRYVLIIDEVIGREEIVIKSLGEHLQNLEYISGGTILGDGTIALIIDTSAIVRKIEKEYKTVAQDLTSIPSEAKKVEIETEPAKEKPSVDKKKISDRKPTALIVDDSISVRRFVASVLEKNNYKTVLASDGVGALECLEKTDFDIVVTDLEMPKMHGFELIEKIRGQEKFKNLPIVILTGRAGKKHREMGVDLGANAFIVKPFKEADLLKILKRFIVN